MFRLVVLSAFVAVAVAAPGHVHHGAPSVYIAHEEPVVHTYEKTVIQPKLTVVEEPVVHHVGNVIKSHPGSVSHHSNHVVHSHGHIVEPILKHGVTKTIVSTPVVEKHIVSAPAVHKTVISTPVVAAHHDILSHDLDLHGAHHLAHGHIEVADHHLGHHAW